MRESLGEGKIKTQQHMKKEIIKKKDNIKIYKSKKDADFDREMIELKMDFESCTRFWQRSGVM